MSNMLEEVEPEYREMAKKLENNFNYVPYKSIEDLKFTMTRDDITYDLLGDIFVCRWFHKNDYWYVKYKSLGTDIDFYFTDDNNFYGVEYFQPVKFTIDNKVYDFTYKFTIQDLKSISDDFTLFHRDAYGYDFASKKLGICVTFDVDKNYFSVLFFTKNYYKEEIEKNI